MAHLPLTQSSFVLLIIFFEPLFCGGYYAPHCLLRHDLCVGPEAG